MRCTICGHVFNDISGWDAASYYKHEYDDNKFTPTINDNDFLGVEYDNNYNIVTQNNNKAWIDMLVSINNNLYNSDWPTRNFVALDQFLEHCWNIDAVMHYLRHTLPRGGMAYISVPDYERYDNHYYCLIKEHIHHFECGRIKELFERYGFELHKYKKSLLPILGGALQLPIFEFVFINKKPPITYCYGASRELLHALETNGQIKNTIIDGIIDDTPAKQGKHINGIPILLCPGTIPNDTNIIITARYGQDKIRDKLMGMGYEGNITCIN